jgi:hypothetical protein
MGLGAPENFFNHSTTQFTCRASKPVVTLTQPTFGLAKLSPVSFSTKRRRRSGGRGG